MRERKQREHKFGKAVSLFEVRIPREDEGIDAERDVFLHPCRHGLRVTDQRGAGSTAHQADPGPEIGADFELIAAPAMQLRYAALADRVHACEDLLRVGDGLIVY